MNKLNYDLELFCMVKHLYKQQINSVMGMIRHTRACPKWSKMVNQLNPKNELRYSVLYLMTCDFYFTILVEVFTNNVLAENTYFTNHTDWTEHKIMVLKPANKYQFIWQCHNFKITLMGNFERHPFLYQAKVL